MSSKLIQNAKAKENNDKRKLIGTFQFTENKDHGAEEINIRKIPRNNPEQNILRYIVQENDKEGKSKERTLKHKTLQKEIDLNKDLSSQEIGLLKDNSISKERTETNDEYNTKLSPNLKMAKDHNLYKHQIQVTNQALCCKNICTYDDTKELFISLDEEKRREEKRREEKRREEKRREEKRREVKRRKILIKELEREEKRREEKRREEKILLIPGEAPRKLWTIINMAFIK